jgi:hypothetical protein
LQNYGLKDIWSQIHLERQAELSAGSIHLTAVC